MSNSYHSFKLVDGYALDLADGYSYTTKWVDVHSAHFFSVSCVLTGGSPAGTFKLQQSNDRQSTAAGYGGDNQPFPVSAAGPSGAPLDAADVPASTTGIASATLAADGVAVLNQLNVGYRWFRVVYTASSNANTTLDIFVHWKH